MRNWKYEVVPNLTSCLNIVLRYDEHEFRGERLLIIIIPPEVRHLFSREQVLPPIKHCLGLGNYSALLITIIFSLFFPEITEYSIRLRQKLIETQEG
jgi:hypothetical protein